MINYQVPHNVVGAKVYDTVIEIGEPLTGEKAKKRTLDISIIMKTLFETETMEMAFDYNGKGMGTKTVMNWEKESASGNFIESHQDEVRRFGITTEQAIDQLRKKLLAKRPSDIKKINEEVLEISKNWVILSPLFLYTLKYGEITKQVIIDAVTGKFSVLK